jgi:hypothetical protein
MKKFMILDILDDTDGVRNIEKLHGNLSIKDGIFINKLVDTLYKLIYYFLEISGVSSNKTIHATLFTKEVKA